MGRIVGGDTAGTANPNSPKGYPTPQDVCPGTKPKGKEEEGVASIAYGVRLLEHLLCVLKPCFPGSGQTSLAGGK